MVWLGLAIQVMGITPYLRATLRGDTQPNRVTWLLWSVLPIEGALASLADGGGLSVVPVFAAGLCPFLVFIATFAQPTAYWRLGRIDYLCGAIGIAAIFAWQFTGTPAWAVVLAVFADGIAAIPTILKSWSKPRSERALTYVCSALAASTSFFAVEAWTFTIVAFPAWLVVMCLSIAAIIMIRRRRL